MTKKVPDQDAPLKTLGMSFLWNVGYVVRPEVLISQPSSKGSRNKASYLDITDVDVLGYRFDRLLSWHTACIDCGSGKGRNPMERAIWLRGLQEAIDFDKIICVVGKSVEEEHRIAALRFGTTLLSGADFENYVKTLTGNSPLVSFDLYYQANQQWLDYLSTIQGAFYDFFRKDNWQREWGRIPITVPGQLKRWGANIDLSKGIHQHGLIELALLLSLGIVRLAIQIHDMQPADYSGTVRSIVLGGEKQSKVVDQLLRVIQDLERSRVVLEGGLFQEESRYDVPHLNDLLDMLTRFLARIDKAILVPRYIQAFQLARLNGAIEKYGECLPESIDPYVTKLALDVFRYLRTASESRDNFRTLLDRI